jgi:hypothetical protein
MKKIPVFLFIILIFQSFFPVSTFAQTKLKKIEFNVGGFIDPYKLTNNVLIPPTSRGRINVGYEINYELLPSFSFKNPRFEFISGFGLSTRHFSINKYRLDNLIILIFPFLSSQDSFHLRSIKYTTNYVNFTTGFSYGLTKKERRVKFFTGLKLVHSFKTKGNIILETDNRYFVPSAQNLTQSRTLYQDQVRKYILRIDPFIDMHVHIYKGAGIKVGSSVFNYYPIPWTKSLTKRHSAIGGNISLYYQPAANN